jgi:Glycosyl hydrolase catalytic core
MSKKLIALTLATVLVAGLITAGATASGKQSARRSFSVGIYDDGMTLGNPAKGFPILHNLRAQVVRITLWWGGPAGVARTKRPVAPANPADPAYNWGAYDRAVQYAAKYKIKVLFSIVGTPAWANGRRSQRFAPRRPIDLERFAIAAARRYSGRFKDAQGNVLPAVHLWLAWNEPNNPVFLSPQYKKVHGRYTALSAYNYVRICNAIYNGVHAVQRRAAKVACGATDPRGNNLPKSRRPSISPLAFLRSVKKFHLRRFDAWAHHPYASRPSQKPTSKPRPKAKTVVILGNIGDLVKEVTRLYGRKPIWITEYGYQTRPPDRHFGVAWKTQAKYLAQAYAIARKNPRIQMMIWFLVKDESRLAGWQSGFFTARGKRKPAYYTFRAMKH